MRADPAHVFCHQLVAALGHHGHFVMGPDRRRAEADEFDAKRVGHRLNFAQVFVHLVAGLVDGFHLRAGKLKLPARLQADIGAVGEGEADHLVLLKHRLPAEAVAQAVEHRLD
ncbi:hypothetical protein GALL_496390 [mine drainage metagenome]|uniref:Uncharacterized protein n=1 Tax=mine drainage metagenome TaxID=410659 RepID=A0A1J5PME6_9ZZZZ